MIRFRQNCLIIALVCFIIIACTGSYLTDSWSHTVILPAVTITVVSDPSHMPGYPCDGAIGCADQTGRVWVVGRKKGNKIIVDQITLGHEIMHLINWEDEIFINPDKY